MNDPSQTLIKEGSPRGTSIMIIRRRRSRLVHCLVHCLALCLGLAIAAGAPSRAQDAFPDPYLGAGQAVDSASELVVDETPPGAPAEGDDSEWQFNYGSAIPPAHAGSAHRPIRSATGTDNRVNNVFYSTSLREALTEMAAQTGRIIMADRTVEGVVTCDLEDVALEDALRIVLSVGNYVFREMDGYILVGSADPDSPSFRHLCETRLLRLNYADPKAVAGFLPAHLKKFVSVNDGIDQIAITAPASLLEEIVAFAQQLDRQPEQVILDARIVALESLHLKELGVTWDWPQARFGGFSSDAFYSSWPWGVEIGYTPGREFTNALLVGLNLLTQTDQAVVLANPQVVAMERETARVSVTTEEYFEILTRGFYTDSELEKIEAGTILEITPRTTEDGLILLEMTLEVSDVIARGENNLPVVTRRTAKSSVVVEDGGTAVVAGLVDNRTRLGKERVPGLGYIPLLGGLFTNDIDQSTKRQVAIFVTPRRIGGEAMAVPPREAAAPVPTVGPEFKMDLIDAYYSRMKPGGER